MKIENRVKNIVRFKTTVGSVTLMPGINELTKEQFAAVKAHPMFEDMVKTSGLVATEEKVAKSYKTKAELKAEKETEEKTAKELADKEAEEKTAKELADKEAEEKTAKELADKEAADLLGPDEDASDEEESEEETEESEEESEEGVDLNEIDLEAQTKATLIDLATSLEIETEGLSKVKLIEAINSKK